MNNDVSTSKFLSFILRHKPEAAGITLDEHGWADVQQLIDGMNIDIQTLERIVARDSKQRYSFSPDKRYIRANQGHSINVDVGLEELDPPEVLYHGTGERFTASIERQGLIPKGRLYVHLSSAPDTARTTGQRHGKPIVYIVMSGEMFKAGYKFYCSVNKVWLTKQVPVQYLSVYHV